MRTNNAPTIRLEDYSPPAYLVPNVDLDIALDPDATRIVSTLTIERTPGADGPLVLDGDELTLVSVRVNGALLEASRYSQTDNSLSIPTDGLGDTFEVTIVTEVSPQANRKLMGLYRSSGVYCTQCEAQGFRRITFFPDRPDVLSIYRVRLEANAADCPVLLSNGNPGETGSLPGGRHFAVWNDPWPKPCYLFAAVAGKLDVLADTFTTASGRPVALNIYVEPGKASMAGYAMDALKRSMVWDEEVYGREYDLDEFNIVAVSDFNMGAMENKGLNVFNDKYVLANPELATDADFMHIEAIIAHEYFHNWTGNRITCRDWFQLCLKEGLTVYRDQEFSADQRSRGVQRIAQVRVLKAGQFSEDAGPLAHCVRPSSYKEINNFYTATVYQKGAELVRMLATLVGPEGYRKATDLYFERHDGEAAVMEDFLHCFEDACAVDLSQFMRWYEQAGTPEVHVEEAYDAEAKTYTLTLHQSVPDTPGQSDKLPMVIPIRFGLLDQNGAELTPRTDCSEIENGAIVLRDAKTVVTFQGLDAKPLPSLLRGFSAPVRLTFNETAEARIVRAGADTDSYNRWEAVNGLALDLLADLARGVEADLQQFAELAANLAFDDTLEPDFRAQLLTLPSEQDVARHLRSDVDPETIAAARRALLNAVGKALGPDAVAQCAALAEGEAGDSSLEAAARRSLKNALLVPLAAAGLASEFVEHQFDTATTMTDKLAAMTIITQIIADETQSRRVLEAFRTALCRFSSRHRQVVRRAGDGFRRRCPRAGEATGCFRCIHPRQPQPGAVPAGRVRHGQPDRLSPRRWCRLSLVYRADRGDGYDQPASCRSPADTDGFVDDHGKRTQGPRTACPRMARCPRWAFARRFRDRRPCPCLSPTIYRLECGHWIRGGFKWSDSRGGGDFSRCATRLDRYTQVRRPRGHEYPYRAGRPDLGKPPEAVSRSLAG